MSFIGVLSIRTLLKMTTAITAMNGQSLSTEYDACHAIILFEESMIDVHGFSILGLRPHRRSVGSIVHTSGGMHTPTGTSGLEAMRQQLHKSIAQYT